MKPRLKQSRPDIIGILTKLYKAGGEPVSAGMVANRSGLTKHRIRTILRSHPEVDCIFGLGYSREIMYVPKRKG